ncbi:hypothetical protein CEY16_14180 [Halalkalibacillus sediminis]|uniref:Uncharacterized protein n=1 Tax=Halalkalibacillus sediminis TaxID=2018042 RepID=A0A2I0QS75_9BACI|nr:hypothetical protein [Halalkalibacillus sediminis]PKR76950.1 hypothetical protein CEY16_14180 [Halalkalibacillus sediminis]
MFSTILLLHHNEIENRIIIDLLSGIFDYPHSFIKGGDQSPSEVRYYDLSFGFVAMLYPDELRRKVDETMDKLEIAKIPAVIVEAKSEEDLLDKVMVKMKQLKRISVSEEITLREQLRQQMFTQSY